MSESFPRQKALTRNFRLGAPRGFRVNAERRIVLFIRSDSGRSPAGNLWCAQPDSADASRWIERKLVDSESLASGEVPDQEQSRRERMREVTEGITAFSVDQEFTTAAFAVNGEIYFIPLPTDAGTEPAAATQIVTAGGCIDPQISPDGAHIAFVQSGGVHCSRISSGAVWQLVTPEPGEEHVTWGLADFAAAEELERIRGFWWKSDSQGLFIERVDESHVEIAWIADPTLPRKESRPHRYPFAGTTNADVQLFDVDLQGNQREITWNRDQFPYLVTVSPSGHTATFSVLSRDQTVLEINAIEVDRVTTLATRTEKPWHTVFPGVPQLNKAGDLFEIRPLDNVFRLCLNGEPISLPEIQVNGLTSPENPIIYTGSQDPTSQGIFTHTQGALTTGSGIYSAATDQNLIVIARATLDTTTSSFSLIDIQDQHVVLHEFVNGAEQPSITPRVQLCQTGKHSLRSAILWPENHVPGRKLPVICAPYGGPHAQRVVQAGIAYCSDQWLANQGFAVVITDNRGTPSRGPEFEYSVHHDLTHVVLEDQVAALSELARQFPDLDLARVGIHGWSFGGYLAALAVIERPDVFQAAVAGAPVTDWALYDTAYTERYLGTPQDNPEVYTKASLITKAAGLGSPLLIIHGLADDNVLVAHTLQLSRALLEAGKDHAVLPLSGVTHMTPQEVVAENLLLTELRFFQEHLQVEKA